MVKFTFRPFRSEKVSPSDTSAAEQLQDPHQRRREQVRRAQKTHRERKESYVKSLETEVMQLRANELRSYGEMQALHAEVNAMKKLLAENGIPISSKSPPPSLPPFYSQDDVEVAPEPELLVFSIPGEASIQQDECIRIKTLVRQDINREAARERNISPTKFHLFPSAIDRDLSQQDSTTIGIGFILSLEAPCLRHISSTSDNEEPSGHALLTSATLLQHQQFCLTGHDYVANHNWTIPRLGVERLLELSTSIPLDGEITPVQAWDYIRHHPLYHTLDRTRLETLKATLLLQVKCYGFGAVLPHRLFENAVFDMFANGGFF